MKLERQEKILSQIVQDRMVSVSRLSELFKVSEITIRRDLDELTRSGKIQRVHGGGGLPESPEPEPPILQRQSEQLTEKEAIARLAFTYICDGNTIGLEAGSTTLNLARLIAAHQWDNLNVVTNSVPILNLLVPVKGISLMFVGGLINSSELCSNFSPSDEMLKHIHIDTYICGCRGLHPSFGRSNDVQSGIEIRTVHAFAAASDQIIVMADHTKFSKIFPVQLLPITEMDVVITSNLAPENMQAEIRQQGVVVEIAEVPEE